MLLEHYFETNFLTWQKSLKFRKNLRYLPYHPAFISLHKLHNVLSVFVPQEDMATVAATDYKLTLWTIEIDAFHRLVISMPSVSVYVVSTVWVLVTEQVYILIIVRS